MGAVELHKEIDMKRLLPGSIFILGFLAAVMFSAPQRSMADAPATASPAPTASATVSPAPSDDKAVASRAREWFGRLQRGDIDRGQLTKEMSDALPADKVAQLSAGLKPLGEPKSFSLLDKTTKGKFTVYRYHLDVTGGALVFTFVLDPEAKIAGLFVANG
jgi:hypothetical protein